MKKLDYIERNKAVKTVAVAHYFKMRVCARDAHVCCVGAKGAPLVTSGPRCGCAFVCVCHQ